MSNRSSKHSPLHCQRNKYPVPLEMGVLCAVVDYRLCMQEVSVQSPSCAIKSLSTSWKRSSQLEILGIYCHAKGANQRRH